MSEEKERHRSMMCDINYISHLKVFDSIVALHTCSIEVDGRKNLFDHVYSSIYYYIHIKNKLNKLTCVLKKRSA